MQRVPNYVQVSIFRFETRNRFTTRNFASFTCADDLFEEWNSLLVLLIRFGRCDTSTEGCETSLIIAVTREG